MWGGKWAAYTAKPLFESKQTASGLLRLFFRKLQNYLQCNTAAHRLLTQEPVRVFSSYKGNWNDKHSAGLMYEYSLK